jgi:hypothetical protein
MTTVNVQRQSPLASGQWFRLGTAAAVSSVATVLVVQVVAMAIWPDIALFKPLDSLPRTVVFTAVPALVAMAVFAWLARRRGDPVPGFLRIAAVVLVLSVIPDYLLPVEHKTFLASTVTAFLHVVAAAVTVTVLITGYRRQVSA